jgi:hypothetical protein
MNGIQGINTNSFFANTQSTNNKNKQDLFLTDAASVLGISYDELNTALQSGKDLETIVEEQGLTEEDFKQQMSELRQANSSQDAPPPPPSGKPAEEYLTDAASVLGVSSEDLESQLNSGADLQTIIKEQGLTMEDFQQQMITLFNNRHAADVDQIGNIINLTI